MAVDTWAINGTAFCYVGTGNASAMELLGYTEQGVDMDITENKTEIMTDLFGDKTPQDLQDMGMVGRMVMPMIAYDRAVMAKVISRGDRTTYGSLNTPGLPMGTNGYKIPVYISAPLDGGTVWYFYSCVLKAEGQRLATKANPLRLEIFAWPYKAYTATTGKDAPLFARALP